MLLGQDILYADRLVQHCLVVNTRESLAHIDSVPLIRLSVHLLSDKLLVGGSLTPAQVRIHLRSSTGYDRSDYETVTRFVF